MKNTTFKLNPIGIVHSPIAKTNLMPKIGIPEAKIEIFEEYIPALHGLDKFSHIYLMCFFHQSDRTVLQLDEDKIKFKYSGCDEPPRGVFCGRSPVRPNPVSLTVVKILSINGNIIEIENCDAIDGTPVIDIKAYNPGSDSFMNVDSLSMFPKNKDLRLKWICRTIKNVTGKEDHLTLKIAHIFMDAFSRGFDYRQKDISIKVSNIPELIDSAMFLTGASFSSGRISIENNSEFHIRFQKDSKILMYSLADDIDEYDGSFDN